MDYKQNSQPPKNTNAVKDSQQLAYLPNFVILSEKTKKILNNDNSLKHEFWLAFLSNLERFFLSLIYLIYKLYKQLRIFIFELKYNFSDLKQIVSDPESTHLFILKFNLNLKVWFNSSSTRLQKLLLIVSRLNLLILAVVVIISTKLLPSNNTQFSRSFLSQAIENYSIKSSFVEFSQANTVNIQTKYKKLEDEFRIKKHEVKEGETIESIAEDYGLLADTLIINNKIEKDKPLPKTLYFPWQDSYLYFVSSEIKPKELSETYSVSEKEIYSQNEDIINYDTGTFSKDKIVIIPTKDFANIKKMEAEKNQKQKEEEIKKELEERKAKFAETYQNQLSQKTSSQYNANPNPATGQYSGQFSTEKKSAGFIWPTKGVISRCIQPGHAACDIANASMPPVYAVQDAIVEDVYRFTVYGYGNAIVLNHGNGIKTLYAHLNEIYVTKGQSIAQGQAIGQMGNTGNSTGTHLHLEVIDRGVKQNPLLYLP
jgi:murein DD-endopeptidase MepM/ murein hydrolase activator NlpD